MTHRTDDWDEAQHPRAPDGKFGEGAAAGGTAVPTGGKAAQRVARAAKLETRAGAKVLAVATKLQTAKTAKPVAVAAAKAAVRDARKAVAEARKDPSAANVRRARAAERAATKAHETVQEHRDAIVKHTAALAEARTQHALVKELHREALRAAKPRPAAAKARQINPRGVGFERVHAEGTTGAVELSPSPEHSFAIGENRIRGVSEQPAIAEEPKPEPAPRAETLLERIVRETPKYTAQPWVIPARKPETQEERNASMQKARAKNKAARTRVLPPAAALMSINKHGLPPAAALMSFDRVDDWDESLHPRDPDGKFGSGSGSLSDRVTASLNTREFVEKHRERLVAAGDRERAKHPAELHGTDAVHAKAQEAIQREAAQIHVEHSASRPMPAPPDVQASVADDSNRKAVHQQDALEEVAGHPHLDKLQWRPEVQQAMRQHYGKVLAQYNLHSNDHGKPQAGQIETRTTAGLGGPADRPDLSPLGLHWEKSGLIAISGDVASALYDHSKLSAPALTELGTKVKAGDADAARLFDSFSTITHETIHGHGSLLDRSMQPPFTLVEEMTTEMATRKIAGDVHGMQVADVPGSYDQFIRPTIDHLEKLSGRSRKAAYEALAHASVVAKQRPGTNVSPHAVLHELGAVALTRLGVTATDKHDALFDRLMDVSYQEL